MIASLSGTLKSISKSEIVLEVNSVGYLLNVSSKVISSLGDIGSKLSMFTDLQVKDDKIVMYGFLIKLTRLFLGYYNLFKELAKSSSFYSFCSYCRRINLSDFLR